jgi:hypothetical protein
MRIRLVIRLSCMPAPDDAKEVLSAFRLGWYFAEMRGRMWPGGPSGNSGSMPDHVDHALPLPSERSKAELRIGVQSVVAELARDLRVDDATGGTSFSVVLGDKAKLLIHTYADKAADALRQALDILQQGGAEHEAGRVLRAGLVIQQVVVARRRQALAAAQSAHAPRAAVDLEQRMCTGEEAGAAALEHVIGTLDQQGPEAAAQAITAITQRQQALAAAARQPWGDLAELIWQFDAHIQDRLTAISDTQAIGYLLGRGLAETYWALDPDQAHGSTSWGFLLGERRCDELSRLTGRLAAYMGQYTAPAIAGSLEVWKEVARTPAWLGHTRQAQNVLYEQLSIWYQLALGEDPTALIPPYARLRNSYVTKRAVGFFSGRLTLAAIGVTGLIVLIILLGTGTGSLIVNTLLAVLAAAGFSAVGLSARRFTQQVNIDLATLAIIRTPPPPQKNSVLRALYHRSPLSDMTN